MLKNMYDDSQHIIASYIILYYIKSWNKVYNWMRMGTLTYIHIGHANDDVIFFT